MSSSTAVSWLRTLGTHYHPTLDPAVLWTSSNDTSRPICSDSLNLISPAPLYLQALWRYTNAVIIIIIIIIPGLPRSPAVSTLAPARMAVIRRFSVRVRSLRMTVIITDHRFITPIC